MPQTKKIAVLGNPNRPGFEQLLNDVVNPAEAAGLDVRVLSAGNEREIEAAFSTLNQAQIDGLLVLSDPVYTNRRDQLARLLKSHKIPAIFGSREIVAAGGRSEHRRRLSSSRRLRRSDSQGRETGRPSSDAANQIRTSRQSQNRQGDGPHDTSDAALPRR